MTDLRRELIEARERARAEYEELRARLDSVMAELQHQVSGAGGDLVRDAARFDQLGKELGKLRREMDHCESVIDEFDSKLGFGPSPAHAEQHVPDPGQGAHDSVMAFTEEIDAIAFFDDFLERLRAGHPMPEREYHAACNLLRSMKDAFIEEDYVPKAVALTLATIYPQMRGFALARPDELRVERWAERLLTHAMEVLGQPDIDELLAGRASYPDLRPDSYEE